MKNIKLNSKNESGFTLVELAIVMIIIGLLIGGILKGQQLIANAEISATVSEVKGVDSAISTFREAYSAMPGDMTNVANRVPNCTNACAQDGNANGSIGNGPGVAHADITNENGAAWAQLAAADMISNIISTNPIATAPGLLNSIPDASAGGQISIDIVPTGWNKSVAKSEVLRQHPNAKLVFFGDRICEGGNDMPLAMSLNDGSKQHRAYPVVDYNETWQYLSIISEKYNKVAA